MIDIISDDIWVNCILSKIKNLNTTYDDYIGEISENFEDCLAFLSTRDDHLLFLDDEIWGLRIETCTQFTNVLDNHS